MGVQRQSVARHRAIPDGLGDGVFETCRRLNVRHLEGSGTASGSSPTRLPQVGKQRPDAVRDIGSGLAIDCFGQYERVVHRLSERINEVREVRQARIDR